MPKISELTTSSTLAGNELIPFVQSGVTKAAKLSLIRGGFINILDYIPVAEHAAILARTSTYNSYNAFVSAIASVSHGSSIYRGGPNIYVPAGKYVVNSTLDLKKGIYLFGDGSGMAPDEGRTELAFPTGVDGIIVNRYNTLAEAVESPTTTGADGTTLEGLSLTGPGSGVGVEAHGIWLRARAVVRNCSVTSFRGNGYHIVATAGSGVNATEGNANCFRVEGGGAYACGGHGMYITGADANGGTVIGFDGSGCGGWGVWDASFLGNTFIQCHTASNVTGAYKSDNVNATCVFLGCYSESGQPTSSFSNQTLIIGGQHGAGVSGGSFIKSNGNVQLDLGDVKINGLQLPNSVSFGSSLVSPICNMVGAGTTMFFQSPPGNNFRFRNNSSGVAWGDISESGVLSNLGPIGFGAGAGSTVTQATSKATGVTLNTSTGQITMNAAALAGSTTVSFTLTNNKIGANDIVLVQRKSGGTAGAYRAWVDSVAAGSCVISVENRTGGSLSEAVVLQFSVVSGVVA